MGHLLGLTCLSLFCPCCPCFVPAVPVLYMLDPVFSLLVPFFLSLVTKGIIGLLPTFSVFFQDKYMPFCRIVKFSSDTFFHHVQASHFKERIDNTQTSPPFAVPSRIWEVPNKSHWQKWGSGVQRRRWGGSYWLYFLCVVFRCLTAMEYILIGKNVANLLYFLAPPSIECLQCCDQVPASLVFTDTTL